MHRRIFMAAEFAATGLAVAPAPAQAHQLIWEDVTGPDNRYRLRMPRGYRYLQVPTHNGTFTSYVHMLPD